MNSERRMPPPEAAARPQVWSIARRFRVLYATSTAILLLVTAGVLYLALERSLDIKDHARILNKAQVLRAMLREESRYSLVLASEIQHDIPESHVHYYIRIFDEQGRVLMETPTMQEYVPAEEFDQRAPTSAASPRDIIHYRHGEDSFLLVSFRTQGDMARDGQSRLVQIALDVSTDLALLADYRRTLEAVLVLGIAFAMTVGGWLARRCTYPLVAITESAQEVTASRLDARIPVSRWPAELVELATAFNGMLDRLEGSFTRLSHFSGELAHALRTPLGNLRGEAEVALAQDRTAQEYREVLSSSMEEYERLSRMVDGLLFIARSDDPAAVVEKVRFDAGKEIDGVREFQQAVASEQGVEITCQGEAWLTGDRMLFRRAVSNLVSNALQHTPRGGSINISLHPEDDGAVNVRVSDTGLGIEPENLPRIFDRFFRTDRSRASVPGGSGLGLAIVASIMRLHGGTVSARSELGDGTTVTLSFPAVPRAAPAGNITG